MKLRITRSSQHHDFVVLAVEGTVTKGGVALLEVECEKVAAVGREVRLDLAGVDYVDEEGILDLKRMIKRGFAVIGVSLVVRQMLATNGEDT